jgi:hypothetical protein
MDPAMAVALVNAYGSEGVRGLYDKWWTAVKELKRVSTSCGGIGTRRATRTAT